MSQEIEKIRLGELLAYSDTLSMFQKYRFEGDYFDIDDFAISPYALSIHIAEAYNYAVSKSQESIDLTFLELSPLSYERMCELVLPMFKQVRGVEFRQDSRKRIWHIKNASPDRTNSKEWSAATTVPHVKKRTLYINETGVLRHDQ